MVERHLAKVDVAGPTPVSRLPYPDAKVVELADTSDLGSGAARRGGSSPPFRKFSPLTGRLKERYSARSGDFRIYVCNADYSEKKATESRSVAGLKGFVI